jgi:hypothetical protein
MDELNQRRIQKKMKALKKDLKRTSQKRKLTFSKPYWREPQLLKPKKK